MVQHEAAPQEIKHYRAKVSKTSQEGLWRRNPDEHSWLFYFSGKRENALRESGGLNRKYFHKIRSLGIKYWLELDRTKIFDTSDVISISEPNAP